jgi:copper chaperone
MHTFQIPKMRCDGCVNNITKSIKALDDNANIHCDVNTKSVTIESVLSNAELIAALVKAGYPPAN